MMTVFREDKSYEEEIKCWQFWHSRQHSAKQRIMDVDTKNSAGIVGNVEEIAHNAIAFYWNPMESPVKASTLYIHMNYPFNQTPLLLFLDKYRCPVSQHGLQQSERRERSAAACSSRYLR